MADNKKNPEVTLKTKSRKGRKSKTQKFPISQANKLLKLSNTEWELSDEGFKWNGKEIAVNSKK